MRRVSLLLIILTAMVTQSCRITTPPLLEILGGYARSQTRKKGGPYSFNKSRAVAMQKGFRDTFVVGDNPESIHGKSMQAHFDGAKIPRENTVFFPRFKLKAGWRSGSINKGLEKIVSKEYDQLRNTARVVHIPIHLPLTSAEDVPRIATNNMLFVVGASNVFPSMKGDRDLYNSSHTRWSYPDDPERDRARKESYQALLEIRATGKVLWATSMQSIRSGRIMPLSTVVSCGDIKESCFTMVPGQGTSTASAILAAMSFYLAQFWETPEEVAEVLKQCSIDVGEPGVDREYGQGVANLLCPAVLKKEIEVVSSFLEETEESPETKGGDLEGVWSAENTVLEVHIPTALKETVQPQYQGTVNGTVEVAGNRIKADITAEASVTMDFLLLSAIEATAEDKVQVEGVYTQEENTLTLPNNRALTYTATEDSLHLIQSYTLNEVLALLPDPLGSMVDMTSEDFFSDDPIQIRMSFAKTKPVLVGDFNDDNVVDVLDFMLFLETFGSTEGDQAFDARMDLIPDGIINVADFLIFVNNFGKTRDV